MVAHRAPCVRPQALHHHPAARRWITASRASDMARYHHHAVPCRPGPWAPPRTGVNQHHRLGLSATTTFLRQVYQAKENERQSPTPDLPEIARTIRLASGERRWCFLRTHPSSVRSPPARRPAPHPTPYTLLARVEQPSGSTVEIPAHPGQIRPRLQREAPPGPRSFFASPGDNTTPRSTSDHSARTSMPVLSKNLAAQRTRPPDQAASLLATGDQARPQMEIKALASGHGQLCRRLGRSRLEIQWVTEPTAGPRKASQPTHRLGQH